MNQQLSLLFGILLLSSCGSDNWKQFHGGEANTGYISVHTRNELIPKWTIPFHIGLISYSSPAIGEDGTIYIGTTTGAMVAIEKDGSAFQWVFHSNETLGLVNTVIVSSPAIGVKGDIYFTVTHNIDKACETCVQLYGTTLVKINTKGQFQHSFQLNTISGFGHLYTTTSPKLLDWKGTDFIFIAARGNILVFDADLHLIEKHILNCSGDLKQGPYPGEIDWDRLVQGVGAQDGAHYFDNYREPDRYWIDPSLAITKKINQTQLGAPILVVAMNGCGAEAFEWNPPPFIHLTSKWYAPRTFEEVLSSPAISESGEVVIGSSSGWVFSYEVVTGHHNWIYNTQEPIVATPAFYAGVTDLYVVGKNNLFRIDNGALIKKFPLPGKTESSCAISMDRIITSSQGGVNSLSIDFASTVIDNSKPGGMSSPAIGKDGTIYVVTANGSIMAYKNP